MSAAVTQLLTAAAVLAACVGITTFFAGLWKAGRQLYHIEDTLNSVPLLEARLLKLEQAVEDLGRRVDSLVTLIGSEDAERVRAAARDLARGRRDGKSGGE